jgi:hypothetical protein
MKTNPLLPPDVSTLEKPINSSLSFCVTRPTRLPSVVLLTKEGPTGPTGSVQASQTQSNPIQPNPTTPPPPGKQIGKETVKFLAIFDHLTRHSLRSNLNPLRNNALLLI